MKSNDDRRSFLKKIAISSVGVSVMPYAFADSAVNAKARAEVFPVIADGEELSCWLESSLNRIFPQSPAKQAAPFELLAARNSRISFQIGFRNNTLKVKKLDCTIEGAEELKPLVRLVGLVPMYNFTPLTRVEELDGVGHLPGLVPDPLMPAINAIADPYASRSFWVTLNIPARIKPGKYNLKVNLTWENVYFGLERGKKGTVSLPLEINIAQMVVKPRENFHVLHWWRGEATWNYYKTEMFDDKWWQLTKAHFIDMLDHGSDVIYVPVLFDIKPVFKRPCQLLIVDEPSPGKYVFDWSRVKKFMTMCKEIGVKKFEWSHLWVYWGLENPVRVYKKVNNEFVMLWPPDISGFSDTFINFLKQFLPQFHKFLLEENVLQDSYFHISDEPSAKHLDNYRKAKNVLKELAPWMHPIMDALSNIEYGKQGLVDIPVPQLPGAKAYYEAKIPHWVYYCTAPKGDYLNRFFDTPLAKLRMGGFLFYHLKAQGFLHWGYNYWNKLETEEILDPFNHADAGVYPEIPYGDPFVVYPGPDGPISSIRWEVFAESLQDYAILQTAGIDPDDQRFAALKTYADYPKSEAWIQKTLSDILNKK
ncbi:DUF4091 domain-containing protein [Pedobacter heparinus]|uniref:DUF4091 domain-containing protein n=1 Tax=Pedobacter heparinus TaxID=984 RepID=UPI00292E3525|nr:DUF4091 domain-containing protein [Pedobacter heparinus]